MRYRCVLSLLLSGWIVGAARAETITLDFTPLSVNSPDGWADFPQDYFDGGSGPNYGFVPERDMATDGNCLFTVGGHFGATWQFNKGFTSISFVPTWSEFANNLTYYAIDITGKIVGQAPASTIDGNPAGAIGGAPGPRLTINTNGAIAVALMAGNIDESGSDQWDGLSPGFCDLSFESPYAKVNADVALSGDVDGDGKDDQIIWRPTEGNWYVLPSSTPNAPYSKNWGIAGDFPIVGHFTGRKAADLVIWRVQDHNVIWFIRAQDGSTQTVWWGEPGDIPAPGDYDGDGKTDIAVYRPTTGTRWIRPSSNPSAWYGVKWGKPD